MENFLEWNLFIKIKYFIFGGDIMGKIVAIGGGESILEIDKFIVEFSEVSNPKLLFIPAASDDSKEYTESITKLYGEQLGCVVDTLLLIDNDITEQEIQEKILSADIIYVGGGDTVKMMDVLRKNKVDEYLKKAYEKNIVLSGISAGSICWFLEGHSDSNLVSNPDGWWDHTQAIGTGLIPAIHCPHYNEKGHEGFDDIIKTQELPGIAIENNCAIVIKDNTYKIIKSNNEAKAYLLKNNNGILSKKELKAVQFLPLDEIL